MRNLILIPCFVIFGIGPKAHTEGSSTGFPAQPNEASANCQPTQPQCLPSECGDYTCGNKTSFCTDDYAAFPTNPILNRLVPFEQKYSDQGRSCNYGGVVCNGGTTTCKINALPVSAAALDEFLMSVEPSNQLPNTISCRYYAPKCNDCCNSWQSNCVPKSTCYTHCPPPPAPCVGPHCPPPPPACVPSSFQVCGPCPP